MRRHVKPERGSRLNLLRERLDVAEYAHREECNAAPPADSEFCLDRERRILAHQARVQLEMEWIELQDNPTKRLRSLHSHKELVPRRLMRRLFGVSVRFARTVAKPWRWSWRLVEWSACIPSVGPYRTRQEAIRDAALWLWKRHHGQLVCRAA